MSGSYIATTTEDDIQWLMAAGQSLGLTVAQLRHHLGQTLSPAHGALLAEPVEDTAGRATDWYGAGEGEATRLDALPPGKKVAMTNLVWTLLRDIRSEGVRLSTSADSDERVLGALLEKVSHVPDLGCVRVRGDAPLVIAWAHGRAGQSIDLNQVYKPEIAPPQYKDDASPAPRASRPGWLVPTIVVAGLAFVAAMVAWSMHDSSEPAVPSTTRPVTERVAPVPPPSVAQPFPAPPAPNPSTTTAIPPQRTDQAALPAPADTQPPASPPPPRPDTLAQPLPTARPPLAQTDPAPLPLPDATPVSPPRDQTATTSRDQTATTTSTPDAAPPLKPNPPPSATASTTSHDETASLATPTPDAPQPAKPDPSASATASTTAHDESASVTAPPSSPASPSGPDQTQTAMSSAPQAPEPTPAPSPAGPLPPHESEAVALARPFTAAAIRKHDIALMQGCWTLRGPFATADVQTHAAANVSQWRTCFAPSQPGAATLAGTQSLAWEDGKSCSGPVTARFLPDDKLEIADAADCLGDRTLFRMAEQCARKDDATMSCTWTAHDRAANKAFNGNGLSLAPAR